MNFFSDFFQTFLFKPFFNILVLIYQYLPGHDFGIAIIILTVIIRIVLYPLMIQSIKSQKALSELQPKLQVIQERFKNDKERQSKELMALYQAEKVNPFGGCLPLLLQLPILIALYRVFLTGFNSETAKHLYSFVPNPGTINPFFLNQINLSESNSVMAILVGITMFIQSKMMLPQARPKKSDDKMYQASEMMQKQMTYFMPLIITAALWKISAAVSLYIIVTTIFSIFQQYLVNKEAKPIEV